VIYQRKKERIIATRDQLRRLYNTNGASWECNASRKGLKEWMRSLNFLTES
jgi:hypothetical protein